MTTIIKLQTQAAPLFPLSLYFLFKRKDISRSRLDNAPCIRLVMSQEATVVPLVLSSQKGLQNCNRRPLFTDRQRAGLPVLIYCCPLSLYFICFIKIFGDPFVLMVHIVCLISFFLLDYYYFYYVYILQYRTRDDIVHLTSFFDHRVIFFSRVLLYTICLFFVPVLPVDTT